MALGGVGIVPICQQDNAAEMGCNYRVITLNKVAKGLKIASLHFLIIDKCGGGFGVVSVFHNGTCLIVVMGCLLFLLWLRFNELQSIIYFEGDGLLFHPSAQRLCKGFHAFKMGGFVGLGTIGIYQILGFGN